MGSTRGRVCGLYDFATKLACPLTADNVGSLEPSFDWQGRRIVFAADVSMCQPF